MLYRTQNPFPFRFNTFSLTFPSPPSASVASLSPPVQNMECLEGSFRRGETEDFLVNNGQYDAAGEDFFVENLLVDGQDVFFEAETGDQHVGETGDKTSISLSTLPEPKTEQSPISTVDDFGSVPADDVADLEWLSHFVEDSHSGYSMTCQIPKMPPANRPEPVSTQPGSSTPVQTKRARTGGRIRSQTSSSAASSSTADSDSDSWLIYPGRTADSLAPPPKKRKKRIPSSTVNGGLAVASHCGHCGVTRTPQWREGPLGARTLCNACGVQFKSGRLFPEYRPACSPTFSSEMHSNSHRKVLEMRRQKEGID